MAFPRTGLEGNRGPIFAPPLPPPTVSCQQCGRGGCPAGRPAARGLGGSREPLWGTSCQPVPPARALRKVPRVQTAPSAHDPTEGQTRATRWVGAPAPRGRTPESPATPSDSGRNKQNGPKLAKETISNQKLPPKQNPRPEGFASSETLKQTAATSQVVRTTRQEHFPLVTQRRKQTLRAKQPQMTSLTNTDAKTRPCI